MPFIMFFLAFYGVKSSPGTQCYRKVFYYLLKASMKVFGTYILAPMFPWVILWFARLALSLLIYQAISFVLDAERPEFVGLAFTGGFLCIYSPITTSIYWEKVLSQFLLPSHPPDPPCARYLTRQPNIEVIWSTAFIGKP